MGGPCAKIGESVMNHKAEYCDELLKDLIKKE